MVLYALWLELEQPWGWVKTISITVFIFDEIGIVSVTCLISIANGLVCIITWTLTDLEQSTVPANISAFKLLQEWISIIFLMNVFSSRVIQSCYLTTKLNTRKKTCCCHSYWIPKPETLVPEEIHQKLRFSITAKIKNWVFLPVLAPPQRGMFQPEWRWLPQRCGLENFLWPCQGHWGGDRIVCRCKMEKVAQKFCKIPFKSSLQKTDTREDEYEDSG